MTYILLVRLTYRSLLTNALTVIVHDAKIYDYLIADDYQWNSVVFRKHIEIRGGKI